MDPVTTAIASALAAGAKSAAGDLAKKAITDGYEQLKGLLKKKFGTDSEVVAAVDELESKPVSAGRQQVLAEELAALDAVSDEQLLAVAKDLLEQLEREPGAKHYLQVARGTGIAQASGGSTATVNLTGTQGGKDE